MGNPLKISVGKNTCWKSNGWLTILVYVGCLFHYYWIFSEEDLILDFVKEYICSE